MKTFPILIYVLACIIPISCVHRDNGSINISYNESGHYYSMKAHFDKRKTRDVERYMDNRIGTESDMSFVNTRIDGQLALNDHTIFYIKKYPGFIEIKLDRTENSYEAYHRIRSMCEGIKEVVIK